MIRLQTIFLLFIFKAILLHGTLAVSVPGESQADLPHSVRARAVKVDIYFAADSGATLWINGVAQTSVSSAHEVGHLTTSLATGDVVAISAIGKGVIAEIIQTQTRGIKWIGQTAWKARRGYDHDWTTKSASSCSWPSPVEASGHSSAGSFPYREGSTYVWAERGLNIPTDITMRYVHGLESCKGKVPAAITFRGDNVARLYVNGKLLMTGLDWTVTNTVNAGLKKGDVVAISVMDDNFGNFWMLASIGGFGNPIETGFEPWKVRKAFSFSDGADTSWTLKSYSSCNWNYGRFRDIAAADNPLPALGLWATDGGLGDTVFFRYVVGGESC